jgi:hypothetical protein
MANDTSPPLTSSEYQQVVAAIQQLEAMQRSLRMAGCMDANLAAGLAYVHSRLDQLAYALRIAGTPATPAVEQ